MFAAVTRASRRDWRRASTVAGSCASGRASTGIPKAPTTVPPGWEAGRAATASGTPTHRRLTQTMTPAPTKTTNPMSHRVRFRRFPRATPLRSSSPFSPSIRSGPKPSLIPWSPPHLCGRADAESGAEARGAQQSALEESARQSEFAREKKRAEAEERRARLRAEAEEAKVTEIDRISEGHKLFCSFFYFFCFCL